MVQSSIISIQLLLLVPPVFSDVAMLLIGGATAFLLAYIFTFGVRAFCYKMNWLDRPAERRVHTLAVPRLGGVAIFLAFVVASLLFYKPGQYNEVIIYWLLLAAGAFTVLVHAYDDVVGLKPLSKILAQTVAVIIILGPWSGTFHGILLLTFNNPFGTTLLHPGQPWYLQPTLFLFIHTPSAATLPEISILAIPAVILTWFWTAGMMNTVNWIDGMDGLATGVVGITSLFVTLVSFMTGQQSIAVLAAIFTGAILGFLPHNWNPAKIFMGDSGSMFLGLGLAVISVMGGAKLALALMVLGVPILDVAIVIINRLRHGRSPFYYDKTHLHHRLRETGLSVRQICYVIYGLSMVFGLLALTISGIHDVRFNTHLYKFLGVGLVGVTMAALIFWMDYRQRHRGGQINLGGPDTPPTNSNNGAAPEEESATHDEPGEHKETSSEKNEVSLLPPGLSLEHAPVPYAQ